MKLSKEVKIGLLATVAFAVVYLGSNFLKGREILASSNSYCTIYDNCVGLSTTSPVLVNGVPVGRVKSIQILPNGGRGVLVTFETKREIQLTDTTHTRLISPSLLGAKAINLLIEPGNPLENHATVPGKVEPSLEDIFVGRILPSLESAQNIFLLTNKFVSNLIDNTDRINSIFLSLEGAAHQLKETIDKNKREIDVVSRDIFEVTNALADSENGVRPLLEKCNQLMEGKEAKEIAEKLGHILNSVDKVFDRTGQGKTSFSRLLYDDDFYNNLNQTLGNLDKLIIDLRSNPWRYISLSIFGKKQEQGKAKNK
ncbi:MAG: MlaD family protein [Amoebophilaceae bacterium]|nr:MlaD family protein [Amoebophilaceae bacterium]